MSNVGFDWTIPPQDGVDVDAQPIGGATGRRALKVEFVNKRWAGPPVQQYLMLYPGRYRFEGRGRSDGLETWLGVQWGLYCLPASGKEPRQLARSGRFLASSDWEAWGDDFAVPGDCRGAGAAPGTRQPAPRRRSRPAMLLRGCAAPSGSTIFGCATLTRRRPGP